MSKKSMRFSEKAALSWKFLNAVFFNHTSPLILVAHVTYRCNLRCAYCGFYERKIEESDTAHLINAIEEFYRLGTRFIVLSGGEPLLREDIGEIIDFCRKKEMVISLNTNGLLVEERIEALRGIDMLKVSLDGPREINDQVRGSGVYNSVVEALALCKANGIKTNITTVISRYNSSSLAHVLSVAKEFGVGATFQPADQTHCGSIDKDISSQLADEAEFKKALAFLMKEKAKGNPYITNSVAGLRHLSHWPAPRNIRCLMSRCSAFLSPEGKVFVCDMFPCAQNYLAAIDKSLKETLHSLSLPHPCQQCWSGSTVDFNLLSGIRFSRIREL